MINNVLLLIPEITKGMKSIGPKSLLPINRTETILDYQIKYIKKFYKNSNIYILTGFENEKIEKRLNKYTNINIVYNESYEICNHVESLLKYIAKFDPTDCLIINNGILLKEKLEPKNNISTIFSIPQNKEGFSIGINTDRSVETMYLFYGLSNQWSECVFLNRGAINKIISISNKQKLSNLFLFELINLIAENGIEITNHQISSKKNILKINNYDDLKKTKGFYDKNLFAKLR